MRSIYIFSQFFLLHAVKECLRMLNHSVITTLHMSLFTPACWKLKLQRCISIATKVRWLCCSLNSVFFKSYKNAQNLQLRSTSGRSRRYGINQRVILGGNAIRWIVLPDLGETSPRRRISHLKRSQQTMQIEPDLINTWNYYSY